jgi:hypothetical protein
MPTSRENPLSGGAKTTLGIGLAAGVATALYYLTRPAASSGSGTTAGVPGMINGCHYTCHETPQGTFICGPITCDGPGKKNVV